MELPYFFLGSRRRSNDSSTESSEFIRLPNIALTSCKSRRNKPKQLRGAGANALKTGGALRSKKNDTVKKATLKSLAWAWRECRSVSHLMAVEFDLQFLLDFLLWTACRCEFAVWESHSSCWRTLTECLFSLEVFEPNENNNSHSDSACTNSIVKLDSKVFLQQCRT